MPTMQEVRTKFPQYNDMPDAQLAEALHKKFYSDIPPDEFAKKIGLTPTQSPTQAAPQQPSMMQQIGGAINQFNPLEIARTQINTVMHPQEALQKADDGMRMLANGMSFGFADKLAGADPVGIIGNTSVQQERAKSDAAKERLGPVTGAGLEIAGSMLPASKLMSAGVTATRLPGIIGKALGMGIDGSVLGATAAAGNDQNVMEGAAMGAGSGLAGQAVGSVLSKALSKIPKQMTVDELKAVAKNSYDKADSLGIVYKPEAIANVANDIKGEFADFGYHPELHQGAKVALGELDRLAANGDVNLKGLETARKIASNAYIPMNKPNNALVSKVIKKIDDFAMNATPNEVVMGNSSDAAAALKNARAMWHRASKLDLVDTMVSKAETRAGSTGSGGNIENATKQNMRNILESESKSRGFTADEKAALTDAVMGSKTQNVMRQVGKFSPMGNGLIGSLEGLSGIGAAMSHGPVAAIPAALVAALGTGAKLTSQAMQRGAVEKLQAMISSGGNAASVAPQLSPEKTKAIATIAKALMLSGPAAMANGR